MFWLLRSQSSTKSSFPAYNSDFEVESVLVSQIFNIVRVPEFFISQNEPKMVGMSNNVLMPVVTWQLQVSEGESFKQIEVELVILLSASLNSALLVNQNLCLLEYLMLAFCYLAKYIEFVSYFW